MRMGYRCNLEAKERQLRSLFVAQQYWVGKGAYRFIGVKEIADAFKEYKTGRSNAEALAVPFPSSGGDDPALVKTKYALNSEPSLTGYMSISLIM